MREQTIFITLHQYTGCATRNKNSLSKYLVCRYLRHIWVKWQCTILNQYWTRISKLNTLLHVESNNLKIGFDVYILFWGSMTVIAFPISNSQFHTMQYTTWRDLQVVQRWWHFYTLGDCVTIRPPITGNAVLPYLWWNVHLPEATLFQVWTS